MKKIFFSFIMLLLSTPLFTQNTGVMVIAPNGGENWIIGCPHTIQWIANANVPVKIELYRNNAFYMTICSQVPSGQTSYVWTPPYTVIPGSTFKVKVTMLTSAAGFDFSDAYFSINRGTITVISPNGGEYWQYGTTHLILWTDNICENVRIELWKGGSYYSLITQSTPSNGSFPWAITNSIPPGNDYKIKILSTALNSNTTNLVFDFSDANFTIGGNGITVLVPNGGEIWSRGSTHAITWLDNIPWNVRIELWKGGVYNSLINASTPSNGTCYWAIPATLSPGNDYKVKVMALSTNSSSLFDFSDNNFTISAVGTQFPAALKMSTNEIKVYPNPCGDYLQVNTDPAILPVSVEIINVTGKIAFQHDIRESSLSGEIRLNTSGLADGFYILVLRKGQEFVFRSSLVVHH